MPLLSGSMVVHEVRLDNPVVEVRQYVAAPAIPAAPRCARCSAGGAALSAAPDAALAISLPRHMVSPRGLCWVMTRSAAWRLPKRHHCAGRSACKGKLGNVDIEQPRLQTDALLRLQLQHDLAGLLSR